MGPGRNCIGEQERGRRNRGSGKGVAGREICGWFNASELAARSPLENEEKLLREEAAALLKRQQEVNHRLSELGL
jgi:hypothetical protein